MQLNIWRSSPDFQIRICGFGFDDFVKVGFGFEHRWICPSLPISPPLIFLNGIALTACPLIYGTGKSYEAYIDLTVQTVEQRQTYRPSERWMPPKVQTLF